MESEVEGWKDVFMGTLTAAEKLSSSKDFRCSNDDKLYLFYGSK